jgi:hypothetical protein
MFSYPLPPDITREQFRSLVAKLSRKLRSKGVPPLANLIIEDMDEVRADGTMRPHFALLVSETAAKILGCKPN